MAWARSGFSGFGWILSVSSRLKGGTPNILSRGLKLLDFVTYSGSRAGETVG